MNGGKTLLVTGGSRGIGAAISMGAARQGWRIAVNYVANEMAADQVVTDIKQAGGDAFAIKGDVGKEADILSMFESVDRRWGRLDGLVNNAGIAGPLARLDEMDTARMEAVLRINALGTMLCAREAVKCMSTRHGGTGGVIVNISSAAAKLGSPNWYNDYAASKGAVESFTRGLALEVADEGIRVNAVRPGIIDTEIHASTGDPDRVKKLRDKLPMKREGKADEVAAGVLFLLSDEASYCTGTILDITGGR